MDSAAHPVEELGVTKLQNTCGHIFCRKECVWSGFSFLRNMLMYVCTLSIMKWITDGVGRLYVFFCGLGFTSASSMILVQVVDDH